VDPADGSSCLGTLTPAGADEVRRLVEVGLARFALFGAEWEPSEARMLTELIEKLEASKAAVAAREGRRAGRGWSRRGT
jgi:hypothetical protein